MAKIVILDGYVANPGDLSWQPIEKFGALKVFDRTPDDLVVERAKNAEILLVNKCELNANHFRHLPKLQCICTLATGYNNIDVKAAKNQGIIVCNATAYSAPSVAQHAFALLLELTNHVGLHNQSVQQNGWANAPDWCYWKSPVTELVGKIMGIYGFGKIGRHVATIALAFGMKVIATRKHPEKHKAMDIKLVALKDLFSKSDVLTLHAPLTSENKGIINAQHLSLMKNNAYLINTGRGGLVNEADLKEALLKGKIAGAGLDVLSSEPPPENHLLLGVPNCIITPHQAWASKASRKRLIEIVGKNVGAYLTGQPHNVVH